jgi:hypothetical protein
MDDANKAEDNSRSLYYYGDEGGTCDGFGKRESQLAQMRLFKNRDGDLVLNLFVRRGTAEESLKLLGKMDNIIKGEIRRIAEGANIDNNEAWDIASEMCNAGYTRLVPEAGYLF